MILQTLPSRNVLSCGGGIQSTAMTLMVLNEDLPRPDAILFADTGWERETTYQNIECLGALCIKAGITFEVVSGGNIKEDVLDPNKAFYEMPFYVNASRHETIDGLRELHIRDVKKAYRKLCKSDSLFALPSFDEVLEQSLNEFDGAVARGEITEGYKEMKTTRLTRKCTLKYKIEPINAWCRDNLGASELEPVGQWIGISMDEWHRMSTSRDDDRRLVYPLISKRLTRQDCIDYITECEYPLPSKSACVGCPMHSNASWQELTDAELTDAAAVERQVNENIKAGPLADKAYFANGIAMHPSMQKIGKRPFACATEDEESLDVDGACGGGCFL